MAPRLLLVPIKRLFNRVMKVWTRCPFTDCWFSFEISTDAEFTHIGCPKCTRQFSARSLARHLEIDKQLAAHKQRGTDSDSYFKSVKSPGRFVAVLEEIRSLWNVGSMFRSADGSGFSHLFLVGISGCPPRKEIAKTSLGAEDHVSWSYCGNSIDVLSSLRSMGYQIVALEKSENSRPLTHCLDAGLLRTPLCLVVGSETKGIYIESLDASDQTVELPMRGFKESLNVAVAFGIAAYTISDRLRQ